MKNKIYKKEKKRRKEFRIGGMKEKGDRGESPKDQIRRPLMVVKQSVNSIK